MPASRDGDKNNLRKHQRLGEQRHLGVSKTGSTVTIKPNNHDEKDDNMPDHKTIATALMRGKLPSREIAGLIYDEADVEQPVAMQTPPPIENVKKAASKSWVKAATAVMSKVPEYFGREVLGHKSKNLKRIYVEYGNDQETLKKLYEFAKDGYSTGEAWAGKIDVEWLRKQAERDGHIPHQVAQTVSRRLMAEGQHDMIATWRHKSAEYRTAFLGGAVGYGIEQNDKEAVEALLANLKTEKARKDAVWVGWESAGGLVNETALHLFKNYSKDSKDLAERLLESGCSAEPNSEANYVALLELLPARKRLSSLVEDEVAEKYLKTTLRYADYDTIRDIIDKRIDTVYERSTSPDGPTEDQREKDHELIEMCLEALSRFEVEEYAEEITGIFGQYPQALSGEAKYQALRFGSPDDTWAWLGDEVNVPDSETFQRLFKNPGRGLPMRLDGTINWNLFQTDKGAVSVETLLNLPFGQELFELMGWGGTEMLLDEAAWEAQAGGVPAVASEYLAEKFAEYLGENLEAWRGAIRVLATSTQPLGRTLRGVAKLYGISQAAKTD
jgi:hypothetical protein